MSRGSSPAKLALVFAALAAAGCHSGAASRSSTAMQPDAAAATPSDPLPSWRDGPTKRSILRFLADVTDPSGPSYVAPARRIAAFDNDGTLWVEKPFPPEQSFAFDRVRLLAADHPAWLREQPFVAILATDDGRLERMSHGEEVELIEATHSGMPVPAFRGLVQRWLNTWVDPRFRRHPTELVYQPMIELLAELRHDGFRSYLCSGDTVEFLRAFAPVTYGIEEEDVAGTGVLTQVDPDPRHPALVLAPDVLPPYNTSTGKPVNFQRLVGRLPILVAGNEDADVPLLALSAAAGGPRFPMLIHHDDADREYAYDRGAERALREARDKGWVVVSMKSDFGAMFPQVTSR